MSWDYDHTTEDEELDEELLLLYDDDLDRQPPPATPCPTRQPPSRSACNTEGLWYAREGVERLTRVVRGLDRMGADFLEYERIYTLLPSIDAYTYCLDKLCRGGRLSRELEDAARFLRRKGHERLARFTELGKSYLDTACSYWLACEDADNRLCWFKVRVTG